MYPRFKPLGRSGHRFGPILAALSALTCSACGLGGTSLHTANVPSAGTSAPSAAAASGPASASASAGAPASTSASASVPGSAPASASGSPNGASATAGNDDDDTDGPDDDYEAPTVSPTEAIRPHAPVLELSDAQIESKVRTDLASLGAMSIGRAYSGALVNGVNLPENAAWERVSPSLEWCTEETRDYLLAAVAKVHAKYPDSPKLYVGNVSTKSGGFFPPHVSHQSGRDVDISYYLTQGHAWYATANAANLDLARTWTFVRALVTETDVEMLLIDRRIQLLLHAYALSIGEDRAWVDSLFQYGGGAAHPIIVHVRGHATHLHIRFRNPVAEELGRRAYPYLVRRGLLRPPTFFVKHMTKRGETLSHLALRYHVSIDVIRQANNMKTDALREGKEYRIPQRGGVASIGPVLIAPRRLPPERTETVHAPAPAGGGS